MKVIIPCPEHIRTVPRNFAWLDRRLRNQKLLSDLDIKELALYVFLVLAADKNGVSYYGNERIAAYFDHQLDFTDVIQYRDRLVEKQLIAFRSFGTQKLEGFCQVLPLTQALKGLEIPWNGNPPPSVVKAVKELNWPITQNLK